MTFQLSSFPKLPHLTPAVSARPSAVRYVVLRYLVRKKFKKYLNEDVHKQIIIKP